LTLPVIHEHKLEHESDSDEPLINFKDNSLLVDIDDNESNKSVEMWFTYISILSLWIIC